MEPDTIRTLKGSFSLDQLNATFFTQSDQSVCKFVDHLILPGPDSFEIKFRLVKMDSLPFGLLGLMKKFGQGEEGF
jgi:hypothetical protein